MKNDLPPLKKTTRRKRRKGIREGNITSKYLQNERKSMTGAGDRLENDDKKALKRSLEDYSASKGTQDECKSMT